MKTNPKSLPGWMISELCRAGRGRVCVFQFSDGDGTKERDCTAQKCGVGSPRLPTCPELTQYSPHLPLGTKPIKTTSVS